MRIHERQPAGRLAAARRRRGQRAHRARARGGPRDSHRHPDQRQSPARGCGLRRRGGTHAGRRVPARRRAAGRSHRRRAGRAAGAAGQPQRGVAARAARDDRPGEARAGRRVLQDQRLRLHVEAAGLHVEAAGVGAHRAQGGPAGDRTRQRAHVAVLLRQLRHHQRRRRRRAGRQLPLQPTGHRSGRQGRLHPDRGLDALPTATGAGRCRRASSTCGTRSRLAWRPARTCTRRGPR
jgi:hypothetical protein